MNAPSKARPLPELLSLPRDVPITLREAALVAGVSLRHLMAERSLGRGPRAYRLGDKAIRSTVADALSWVSSRAEGASAA